MPEQFLATLVERFGNREPRVGTSPDPLLTFPPKHPEVGEARVWAPTRGASSIGEVITVTFAIGDIIADHFRNFDFHLAVDQRVERVTNDIVRFLQELFTDRLLFWKSMDDAGRSGWRERGDSGHTEPLVLDDRTYRTYVWSGPLAIWRATPHIVARGRIRDEREYQILLRRLQDAGPGGLQGEERELVAQMVAHYERELER